MDVLKYRVLLLFLSERDTLSGRGGLAAFTWRSIIEYRIRQQMKSVLQYRVEFRLLEDGSSNWCCLSGLISAVLHFDIRRSYHD